MTKHTVRTRTVRIAAALFAAISAATFCPTTLSAQTLEEGYKSQTTTLPAGAGQVYTMPSGTVYFTGTKLVLDNQKGTRDLLTFPSSVYGSFTVSAGRDALLFGESSNGTIWLVPTRAGGTAKKLATLAYNYDAQYWHFGKAIISAKTGGFASSDNELHILDLSSGKTSLVAIIPGSSGPVAVDISGGVYYATSSSAFPAPPGQTDILYFSGRQINNAIHNSPLTPAEAKLIYKGLDSASALILDHDGDLLSSDWMNSQIVEISRGPGGKDRKSTLMSYQAGNPSAGGMQLVRSNQGRGSFEPFQPAGYSLIVHESAWQGTNQLNHIAPARAETKVASPVAPGPFDITTTGCAANGIAIIAIGFPVSQFEHAIHLGMFEQTLFWSPSMFRAFNTYSVSADAQGTAMISLTNPGLAFPVTFGTQTAFVSANGSIAGTAAGKNFRVQ